MQSEFASNVALPLQIFFIFSFISVCLVIHGGNLDMMYQVIGAKVNRPIAQGFMLFWYLFNICCSCRYQRHQLPPVS